MLRPRMDTIKLTQSDSILSLPVKAWRCVSPHTRLSVQAHGHSVFACAIKYILCLSFAFCTVAKADTSPHTSQLPNQSPEVLSILIPTSIVKDFNEFIAGRDILSIHNYGGLHSRREVADLILLHQALYLGGYKGRLEYQTQEVDYLRSLHMLADGKAAIFGSTAWYEHIAFADTPFWVSEPLVQEGEFVVGIYTASKNEQAMSVKSLADLKKLRAVSNQHWASDWRNLKLLELPQIYSVRNWDSMARMVYAQRADFTLAPFRSTPGRELPSDGFNLTPIPNISFALEGSRHWVTSKAHPLGRQAYESIERGLKSLRNQGTVTRAYQESGFFQPQHAQWPAINRRGKGAKNTIRQVATIATE